MRKLTTKQSFAIIFSVFVFFFLVILCSFFIVIFNFTTNRQLKRELFLESIYLINNHLFLDNDKLEFKKDETGISLRENLLSHNITAVFMDNNGNILRSYGLFALGTPQDSVIKFIDLKNRELTYFPKELNITWRDQPLITLISPLKNNGKVVGFLILGKSTEEYAQTKQMMLTIFAALGILGLVGSFVIGYLLTLRAFYPLLKMTRVIEGVEFDNLDTRLKVEGNKDDELVQLGQNFNEMLSRLRDMANRQKSFIANASHELKTPLTRAISSLELLSLTKMQNKEEVMLVRDDLFQINTLLERLLLLTKMKKDINTLKPYKLNMYELISILRKRFEGQWKAKGLKFYSSAVKEVYVAIPREYLLIILSNLLSNSTKYSKPYKNIFLNASVAEKLVIISVSDEGVGINKEEAKHIFDRFYRKDGEMQNEGYGIGLSVVKQICDLYNIKIEVTSQKDKGTKITLLLKIL